MIYLIPSAFSTGNSFTAIEKHANFVDTFHINVTTEHILYIELIFSHDFFPSKIIHTMFFNIA